MTSTPSKPHLDPDLRPYERLTVFLAEPELLPEEEILKETARISDQKDWFRFMDLMRGHQVESYGWYQLKRVADHLPPDIRETLRDVYHESCQTDLWQAEMVETLSENLDRKKIPHAFVKGLVVHKGLYDGSLPRGAADIDFLIFGNKEKQEVVFLLMEAMGFYFKSRGEEMASSHDWAFVKKSGNFYTLVEPHQAPSIYLVKTKEGSDLQAWLSTQVQAIPWQSAKENGPGRLPGLTPGAALLYSSINFVKDGVFRLRSLNDFRLLLRRHGKELDWKTLNRIAQRTHTLTALQLALDTAARWDGPCPTTEWNASFGFRFFKPYLALPNLIRSPIGHPGIKDSLGPGNVWNWWPLIFGWRPFARHWLNYERRRMNRAVPQRKTRILYVFFRVFQLIPKLFRSMAALVRERRS